MNNYEHHPYKYGINNGKDIIFEDDYIYIVNNIKELKDGDMRISFHELRPILYATLIAQ